MSGNLLPVRFDIFGKPDIARLGRTLDNLSSPSQCGLGPVLAFPFAIVASIQPDMTKPRKLSCHAAGEQHHPITIHDVGSMHFGFEDQALGIDQQMALASLDLLA